ncbi:pyridoxal phosphate-dependent aminotransferase [Halomonas halocynthiae]|uniref:pyridoxal phosphate-dependent aminotransferase n=1 Tax=Halomonas halocynthiae TaxID=176290 RepID=UPI000414079E|nr:aminotransferase class I/II-fold pyridoxal phosphate-dependent enzyme [Halomonas halocynthiae]
MPRFNEHLSSPGPNNPFPGVRVLERQLGHAIPHQLGSNEGLDMPHSALRRHFGDDMVKHVYSYGDSEALGIRQRLAKRYGFRCDELLVDAGCDSLLALVLRATCSLGDCVIATAGTYPTFAYFARGQGCRLIETGYDQTTPQPNDTNHPGLAPDLAALAHEANRHKARLVYVANPDNPSGHLHSDAAISQLRTELPDNCWLLLDEAYNDFRLDAERPSANQPITGVIRCRTLSKAHGLAGLRVGYAIASPEVLAALMKVRIHYAVSTLSQAAAEIVLDHPDETRAHILAVQQRRDTLASQLADLGADVLPSATNFVALRLPSAELADQVHRDMLNAGRLIAKAAHPELGRLLRISALDAALTPNMLDPLTRALPSA